MRITHIQNPFKLPKKITNTWYKKHILYHVIIILLLLLLLQNQGVFVLSSATLHTKRLSHMTLSPLKSSGSSELISSSSSSSCRLPWDWNSLSRRLWPTQQAAVFKGATDKVEPKWNQSGTIDTNCYLARRTDTKSHFNSTEGMLWYSWTGLARELRGVNSINIAVTTLAVLRFPCRSSICSKE